MSRRGTTAATLAGILLASAFQGHCAAPGKDRFVRVFLPDGGSVMAELAVTDEERARGLMFRERVEAGQGMLFVFEEEGIHAFWMKNTLVPLDIIWLGRDRRIVHIAADVPPCKADPCPSYGPELPAAYVLELRAGEARARGLEPGDRLEFIL